MFKLQEQCNLVEVANPMWQSFNPPERANEWIAAVDFAHDN